MFRPTISGPELQASSSGAPPGGKQVGQDSLSILLVTRPGANDLCLFIKRARERESPSPRLIFRPSIMFWSASQFSAQESRANGLSVCLLSVVRLAHAGEPADG